MNQVFHIANRIARRVIVLRMPDGSATAKRSINSNGKPELKKPKLITDFFQQKSKDVTAESTKKPPSIGISNNQDNHTTSVEGSNETTTKHEKLTITNIKINRDDSKLSDEEKYAEFCAEHNFNKQAWINSLTTEQRDLLDLEIKYLHITWLVFLHKTITQPYFLKLKQFLKSQSNKTVFPPREQIYSWSHYTPLPSIKCLVLGQDPYHNFNQAHGLAFSVLEPTRPPPSLLNIYKTLKIDYPNFEIPEYYALAKQGRPGGGNLTKWAKRGVLLLNAVLTVECHKANSHAQQGWETFTEEILKTAINYYNKEQSNGFVIMAWGSPAQKRIQNFNSLLRSNKFLVLKTVHPSPLSARRGFFDLKVFKKCNDWLAENGNNKIDWGLIDGNVVL